MRLVSEFSGTDAGIIIMSPNSGSKELTAHIFFSVADGVRLVEDYAADDPNRNKVIANIRKNSLLPKISSRALLHIPATFSSSMLVQMVAFASHLSNGSPSVAAYEGGNSRIIAVEVSKEVDFPDAFMCWVDPDGVHTFAVCFSEEDVERIVNGLTWLNTSGRKELIGFMKRGSLPIRSDTSFVLLTGQLAGFINSIYVIRRLLLSQVN